ncbi:MULTISPECIES: TRAP transporter substrate-binding protein [unclassified Sulfitobacter]|uniref:TRAP transporter substrate-binding protein n=1 Tax=unclassified Sulfitobacter TaxID=196795 RepID=UPI0007C3CEF1|nr:MULTISPECIES: TRAP transporter substrate-binding protein [unclassified Sulfitobacter]KZX94126.1 C4-dicarboxylate ABC transporter [Sulfitobacter sp. HI0023]KZY25381.1 C4-dicarboxylate ABC transporter [Sulfitobacter sp. HI0040]KZZ69367.1 C4-dicarboxylate ABC transporter [Sulfitobacter sp. HI0129]MBO28466.1 C4-dicarboxylate ABC transporter [Paracoccaceae bacterium]
MTITRTGFLRLAGAATLALGLGAVPALAQEVTLRLHQFLPPQANVPKLVLDVWADKVEADSDGRIKVERYPSMQLGGTPPELMDQAIDGVADIVWTVVGYTPGRYPSTEVFELPFMMTNARAASSAYWQMFEKHMKDTEFKDVHILATWVHGPGLIHANKEVRTPSDMQGLKIRGGSRLANALLEKTGATPVGMPVPAIPEGLSKGVIDGATIPWEVTAALKVPELVNNHTEFTGNALYVLTFVLAMNKDKYESLPDDLKKVIDDNSGLEFSIFAGGTQADADGPAREAAVAAGNNIVTLNEEETQVWREAAQPVYDDWIADMESKGIDGQALIDEARALMDAYQE